MNVAAKASVALGGAVLVFGALMGVTTLSSSIQEARTSHTPAAIAEATPGTDVATGSQTSASSLEGSAAVDAAAAQKAADDAAAAKTAADAASAAAAQAAANAAASAAKPAPAKKAATQQASTSYAPGQAPKGTPLPSHIETDPNSGQYGQPVYDDPGSFCAARSGSTIGGVPQCD